MNHLNQEPLDFASARNLLRQARTDLLLAIALLRELNDALLPIPDALQARVDILLDRAEGRVTSLACARVRITVK